MNAVGSDSSVAALVALAAYIAMKLIDRMLPDKHHFKIVDRWMAPDDHREDDDEPNP